MNIKEQIAEKRTELANFFASKKGDDGKYNMTDADRTEYNNREAELKSLNDQLNLADAEIKNAAEIAELAKVERTFVLGNEPARKSIGRAFIDSPEYKSRQFGGEIELPGVDVKTLMTTSANGYAPQSLRTGDVVPMPHRPLSVVDLLRKQETTQNSVKFMAQTVLTNNAAEAAEGATFGTDGVLTWAEQLVSIVKIPAWIPITDEQLDDVEGIAELIDSELSWMVMSRCDSEILNGNGAGANMTGLLSGATTVPKGANPVFDAIGLAIKGIQATEYLAPNAVIMHPTDWWNMRLTRTVDGLYILGNPAEAGPATVFGLNVVQSTAITAGTALVGDFNLGAYLAVRQGVLVEYGYNTTDFVYGKKTIRATVRVGLPIRRAAAFAKVTGLS